MRRSRLGTWLRRSAIWGVALAVLGSLVFAFLPKPVGVDLATVELGRLRVTVDEDGQTRIKERYVVSSPLSGRLLRIGLDVGDSVAAGTTVMARIEPTDPDLLDPRAQAQAEARVKAADARLQQSASTLEKAQAALDYAESEVARIRRLREQGAATPSLIEEQEMNFRLRTQEFREATFAQEIAQFELELEQAALLRTQSENTTPDSASYFEIRAPISGRVLRVMQESATIVSPGMQLAEVGEPSDLEVVVDVLSSDAVKILPGARAELDQWGGSWPLQATVRLVEPSGFTKVSALGVEEQRVNVVLDFLDPPEQRATLGDGFRVEARIVIWEEPDVIKVPTSALFRYAADWAVFAVDTTTATASRRLVEVGRQNGLEAQILSGLEPGEQIVTHPSDQLDEGVQVFVR